MFTAKRWAHSVQSTLSRPTAAFWLLALINLFVGGMVGLERTVVPLLGSEVFNLREGGALGAFVISFGISKALFNLVAGALADRIGRKRVLVLGWTLGVPIPFLLMWAPSWNAVVAANVLLGINQALSWSMTINMMVDLASPERRGLAVGINEFSGYLGVGLLAFLTGLVATAFGLRPEPFYLGVAVVATGLALALAVPETAPQGGAAPLAWVRGVGVPSLLGAATNLKDGLVWLALPLLLTSRGFDLLNVAIVAGLYPLVWAGGQLVFGALSDRWGRRRLIVAGIALQGLGLMLLAGAITYPVALAAAFLLGLGTSMAYPTLIAVVADRAPETERATALGIYRFFRDGGYVLGAVLIGLEPLGLTVTLLATGLGFFLLAAWSLHRL